MNADEIFGEPFYLGCTFTTLQKAEKELVRVRKRLEKSVEYLAKCKGEMAFAMRTALQLEDSHLATALTTLIHVKDATENRLREIEKEESNNETENQEA